MLFHVKMTVNLPLDMHPERAASLKAMEQVTGPIISTTLVLFAIFAPVAFLPGISGEMFRQFAGLDFGGILIRRKAVHETADGRRLLILHGDEFDAITLSHRWLAHVGDFAYNALMAVNRWTSNA